MPDVGISAYQFSVKELRRDNFLNLTAKIDGKNYLDILYDGLANYLTELQRIRQAKLNAPEQETEEGVSHTIKRVLEPGRMICKETVSKDGRDYYEYLYFTVKSGEFGTRVDIENTKTGSTEFVQEPHHAGVRHFHVLLAMSCDPEVKHGIIAFERMGISGIKSLLVPNINNFFSKQVGWGFKVKPIFQLQYLEKLLEACPIEKMRLIKYYESPDRGGQPFCTKEERIFTRPIISDFRSIFLNIANSKNINRTGIGIIDGFSPDCMGLTLDVHGKSKTIELTDIENVSFTEYFTRRHGIEFDTGNLPTDKSLLPVLLGYIEEQLDIIS